MQNVNVLPSCCVIEYSTDLSWALAQCIFPTAFLLLTISLAKMTQTSFCPFFAASFNDFCAFNSSLCIPKNE